MQLKVYINIIYSLLNFSVLIIQIHINATMAIKFGEMQRVIKMLRYMIQ